MAYPVPPVPPGVADDPQAQAAYLLEDGFSAAPEDALVDKLRRSEPLRVKFGASLLEILSPEGLEVRRNSDWLEALGMAGALELTAQATVAQLLERDDFSKRFSAHEPISLIEFMYPLLQGQDCVAVQADVELGGTDQYFNCRAGPDAATTRGSAAPGAGLRPAAGRHRRVGTDGTKKMSQSIGNYIGVAEDPKDIFGKVMSLPDEAMPEYVRLALDLRPSDKDAMLAESSGVVLKRRLAREMIAMFHGAEAAVDAEAEFDRVFVHREAPSDMEYHVRSGFRVVVE
jgi:tyrosyl-tRNA synthetase